MTFSPLARKRRRVPALPSPPSMVPVRDGLPMTPPDPEPPIQALDPFPSSIATAIHVISTERAALTNLERIYTTDKLARENMELAVNWAARSVVSGGKVVISGVGKSGKIGEKAVATMNSMGVQSAFMHPTEALHGDLGMVRPGDTIILISFSGKTAELLLLLSHLPSTVSVIAMTSHTHPSSCPLLEACNSPNAILLPTPVHEHEEVSFGLSAPTTSTTVALALCDALALAVARRLHTLPGRGPAEVFREFHPGGSIGAALASSSSSVSSSSVSTTPVSMSTTVSDSSLTSTTVARPQRGDDKLEDSPPSPPSGH